MERLNNLFKLNKSSFISIIVSVIVFVEILVMAPQVLEQENAADFDENSEVTYLNEKNPNQVENRAQGVHLVENSGNEKGWELFASEATGNVDGQWNLQKVKVQFFNENRSNYIVTGDVGEIEAQTKDMIISGNVTTISSNGYMFKTNTLRYISRQKIMTSLDQVVMQGPPDGGGSGFRLTGEKLLVDMVKNKMSILDKVSAVKTIDDKPFNLKSVRADFFNANQEASFSGDVNMKLGDMLVKAPTAFFQYSGVKRMLESITLKDSVEFVDSDKKGFCKELIFNLVDNKMTMRGQPKVEQGEDEISGYEIVFVDGGKRVKINQAPKGGQP